MASVRPCFVDSVAFDGDGTRNDGKGGGIVADDEDEDDEDVA